MLKYIKRKITNFASYMLGLETQLANAKNDAERVKILTQIAEAQKQQIEDLDNENSNLKEENAKLKEQIKEHEDLESLLSSGSSVSSSEGIDTKIDQDIKDLETLLLNSKKSTATVRKEIKLLKRIKKLKFLNYQKDKRIKDLEKEIKDDGLVDMLVKANQEADKLGERIKQTQAQIEVKK